MDARAEICGLSFDAPRLMGDVYFMPADAGELVVSAADGVIANDIDVDTYSNYFV